MVVVVKFVVFVGRLIILDWVYEVLGCSMLVDGLDIVFDLICLGGLYLVDVIMGWCYLDMFIFVVFLVLGMNFLVLVDDWEFYVEFMQVVLNKFSNFDVYLVVMVCFVEIFVCVLGDLVLLYLFFVEGGVLVVENVFKVVFDWKSWYN